MTAGHFQNRGPKLLCIVGTRLSAEVTITLLRRFVTHETSAFCKSIAHIRAKAYYILRVIRLVPYGAIFAWRPICILVSRFLATEGLAESWSISCDSVRHVALPRHANAYLWWGLY